MSRSLTGDDLIDPECLAMQTKNGFQKSHEMRMAATIGFAKLDAQRRLNEAAGARSAVRRTFSRWVWVFIRRKNRIGQR